MSGITGNELSFQYRQNRYILQNVSFTIEPGKMTAILGRNGCGKSTLVKIIAALLPLREGTVTVWNMDLNTKEGMAFIRGHCGIVFQNPDNQFVSPIIEDDIRFGLDNRKIPEAEQNGRIRNALEQVNLSGFNKRNIATLSGGQKQRAAAAGVIAQGNDIYIFDEATAMLDPEGKRDMLACIDQLREQGKTVITVTQNVQDAVNADKLLLLSNGKIIAAGSPAEILTDADLLEKAGVQIPFPVTVYNSLKTSGFSLSSCPLTLEALAEEICSLKSRI